MHHAPCFAHADVDIMKAQRSFREDFIEQAEGVTSAVEPDLSAIRVSTVW